MKKLANYTWSHCISDPYDQQTSGNGLTPPGNRRAYRGNCTVGNADVCHYFTLNMVMNAPRFSNGTLQKVLGNWQIAPILQLKSGNFLSILSGTDRALTTAAGQTANQVLADVSSPNKGKACALLLPASSSSIGMLSRFPSRVHMGPCETAPSRDQA